MADIILANNAAAPTTPSSGFSDAYFDSTSKKLRSKADDGTVTIYPYMITDASGVGATGFATDTYLSGSSCTVPVAGDWTVGMSYYCMFDMTKTNVGTAAFTITVRMGTAGTTSDTTLAQAIAFGAGTGAIDEGIFETWITFKTVGSGTSAVVAYTAKCAHHLAATGLISTGASGIGIIKGTSAGFNSTTPTIIGMSINGGASFAGTNVTVQANLTK